MVMSCIIAGATVISVIFGIFSGNLEKLGASPLEGAAAAVTLCVGICGVTCLWMGLMEVMSASGLAEKLAALLRPALSALFPKASKNPRAAQPLAQNVSANLLGLGNAATPSGIAAMAAMAGGKDTADDEVCRLAVMNSASIQLLPTTVAAVRASLGCSSPFDILACVWITSAVSVTAGLVSAKLFSGLWRKQ